MAKIRFGVVGLGFMGAKHARLIAEASGREIALGAVTCAAPENIETISRELDVPGFDDAGEMFDSGLIDAVVIATPHYLHPPLIVRAAQAGLHVLSEKPLAATVGAARTAVEACEKAGVALGVVFQQRSRDAMIKMKRMVERGQLGEIYHASLLCSDWYRTQAYYEASPWRGTWDGEGGGVLINQASHSLDLFQWIAGMPRKVAGFAETRYHDIEAENTAAVSCWYGPGRTGAIYLSTAHAPGQEVLRFSGDKGTLVFDGTLKFGKLETPLSKHLARCPIASPDDAEIEVAWREVECKPSSRHEHMKVLKAFVAHLQRGKPMIVAGREAINELEISNAILLSGYGGKVVDLPVNARAVDRLMARLERERSTGEGGGLRKRAQSELRKLLREGT